MQSPWRAYVVGSVARPASQHRLLLFTCKAATATGLLRRPSYCLPLVRVAYSSTHQHQSWHRLFRFRSVPAFAALLLAQLLVIWDVSNNTDIFETGNRGKFLSSSEFLPYTIVHKDLISPNSCILTLRPGTYDGPVENCAGTNLDAWKSRLRRGRGMPPVLTTQDISNLKKYQDSLWREGIWSIEVKQPHMSITRLYTPLPPDLSSPGNNNDTAGVFRLFIRREPEGEVSRYLYGLPEGATIELRGGFLDYQIPENVTQLAFIAGGTGIAPALATAYGFALRQVDADVRILWANRRREDCTGGGVLEDQPSKGFFHSLLPNSSIGGATSNSGEPPQFQVPTTPIVRQLTTMQLSPTYPPRSGAPKLDTKYFVDEERSFIKKADITNALRISSSDSRSNSPASRRLVLISGPDGFVEHVAGPKVLKHGQELQGPRGGLLAQVDLCGWEVWKL